MHSELVCRTGAACARARSVQAICARPCFRDSCTQFYLQNSIRLISELPISIISSPHSRNYRQAFPLDQPALASVHLISHVPASYKFYNRCGYINSIGMQKHGWKALRTLPKLDVQKSLPLMSPQQIDLNMVEISLLSLNNEHIMWWLQSAMARDEFYLKYRYLLDNLINGSAPEPTLKLLALAAAKFDESYINGAPQECYTEQAIFHMPALKEKRLKFVLNKEKVMNKLDAVSTLLFKFEDKQAKRSFFEQQMEEINCILQEKGEDEEDVGQLPSVLKGFIFCTTHSLRKLVNINIKNSFFIETKNRNPIVLDFEFARYLYKNDDQLAHEIIAMELIKYVNALLGKQYAKSYDIIPEKRGALYEFIENSKTIHQIKERHEEGLIGYVRDLGETGHKGDEVMNTFAESYSGFCLLQYLLDIKDRNNANIMVTDKGAIFHIDLAFIFSAGPGGLNFQSAPFKMTKEMVKTLGGFESDYFRKFQALLVQHFTKLFECKEELFWKLDILSRRHKQIRCFKDFKMKSFMEKLPKKQEKVRSLVEDLIDKSYDSWKTTKYDDFQFKSNGILK